jgi:hypothetical protein
VDGIDFSYVIVFRAVLSVAIPGCPHPMSPSHPWKKHLVEVRGSAQGAELWALIFLEPGTPIREGKQVKIVWRMTGEGRLSLVAVSGMGTRLRPDQVQSHGGSNWHRPGDEWGSLFTFPEPGCWDIHAERAAAAGDVWVTVR